MSGPAISEIQSLEPSALLKLFVLDASVCGGGIFRFHNGTNGLAASVVWANDTYVPFPIEIEGFEWSTRGTLPRPKLRVSNADGMVSALVRDLEDLVGATVIMKQMFAKHLDAVNGVPGGTPDPTACWPDEPFIIERKSKESSTTIEFELCTPLDQQNSMIPKRRITANVCGWVDVTICQYSVNAQCTKTLNACQGHWGLTSELPFGGFPGTARAR